MMKLKTLFRASMLMLVLFGMLSATGCKKTPPEPTTGTIKGVVTDLDGAPLAGVTATLKDATSGVQTVADGSFIIENVPLTSASTIIFTKEDYLEISVTVNPSQFVEYVATIDNVMMEYAGASIVGTVIDAGKGGIAIEGVTVTIDGMDMIATTNAEGKYILDNLTIQEYNLIFSKGGFLEVTKTVSATDFSNGVATIDAEMGARELLRGKTAEDLASAGKWLYSDYRGGRNGDDYPHFDWSVDFLCTSDFEGWWEEQNEGSTLQIRNSEDEGHWSNPADLEVFDSYMYGSKMITEENKHMTLRLRTHAASEDAPAYFGVQVIDLSVADPQNVMLTEEPQTLASEDYTNFYYDLSNYVGKEVIIAVGIFRAATGDYWKQLVIRRIAFSSSDIEDWGWPEGTIINDAMSDWKLSREAVKSNMVQSHNTLFTGISPVGGDRDNYRDAYRSWKDAHHIAYDWTLVPRYKDSEPLPGEGFIIKTRGGGTDVNLSTPEAYFYGKFEMNANTLELKARTFDSTNPTYFKLTAIDMDYNVTEFVPTSTVGQAGDGNTWKFCNEDGDPNNVEGYATFTYDISSLKGKTVVLALGVYKGEINDGEQKLAIYSVEMK